jgi:hypothetical protein
MTIHPGGHSRFAGRPETPMNLILEARPRKAGHLTNLGKAKAATVASTALNVPDRAGNGRTLGRPRVGREDR